MSVTLAQLRAFVAVADHGGFVTAADELGITQSAVSHAIAALEAEIGLPLIARRPSMSLTALGADVLGHARSALASVDALEVTVRQQTEQHTGMVRLAAPATVCFGLLPQMLADWRRMFPGITVQVFEGDDEEVPAWLEDGTVDAAVLINPSTRHPDAVVVGEDAYGAVLRDDHPLAGCKRVTVDELLDDPILVSANGCGPEITELFRSRDPNFAHAQQVYDNAALLNFVAVGLGVTVFPSIGSGMLPAGTRMIPLEPAVERTLVFSGPMTRPWNPLLGLLQSTLGVAAVASDEAAATPAQLRVV